MTNTTGRAMRDARTPATVVLADARNLPSASFPEQRRHDLQTMVPRRAKYPMDLPASDSLRRIGRVGIIGADAVEIAMRLLDMDIPVTLFDFRRESTIKAVATARSNYEELVISGQLAANACARRMALLTGAANFHHLKDCDIVVSTLSSDLKDAEKLFRRLDDLVKQTTILATNHTVSEINHIAAFTRRSANILGLRFSNPVAPLHSLEVVRGDGTSDDTFGIMDELVNNIRIPEQ